MSALIAAIICTFEWTADEIVLELECSGDLVGARRTDGLAGAVSNLIVLKIRFASRSILKDKL